MDTRCVPLHCYMQCMAMYVWIEWEHCHKGQGEFHDIMFVTPPVSNMIIRVDSNLYSPCPNLVGHGNAYFYCRVFFIVHFLFIFIPNLSVNITKSLTTSEMELCQSCSMCNFTNLETHPNVSEKDTIGKVSLHRKQWCKFHLHISFLSQVTLNFRLNVFTL